MFARNSWKEIVIRILLIAAIVFNAPSFTFSARAADETATPTEAVTETPPVQPTVPVTQTPVAETATPIPPETITPSESSPTVMVPESEVQEGPSLTLSTNPEFVTPGGYVNLNWQITGIPLETPGLILQILFPEGVSPREDSSDWTFDDTNRLLTIPANQPNRHIQLDATTVTTDFTIVGTLLQNDQVLAVATVPVVLHEQFQIDMHGGSQAGQDTSFIRG